LQTIRHKRRGKAEITKPLFLTIFEAGINSPVHYLDCTVDVTGLSTKMFAPTHIGGRGYWTERR
jgi:hypothetical protein